MAGLEDEDNLEVGPCDAGAHQRACGGALGMRGWSQGRGPGASGSCSPGWSEGRGRMWEATGAGGGKERQEERQEQVRFSYPKRVGGAGSASPG